MSEPKKDGFGFRPDAPELIGRGMGWHCHKTYFLLLGFVFCAFAAYPGKAISAGWLIFWLSCSGLFLYFLLKQVIVGYDALIHNCPGQKTPQRNSENDLPRKWLAVQVVSRKGGSRCEFCPQHKRVFLRIPLSGIMRRLGRFTEGKFGRWRFSFMEASVGRVLVFGEGSRENGDTRIVLSVADLFVALEDPESILPVSEGPDDYIIKLALRAAESGTVGARATKAEKAAFDVSTRLKHALSEIKELVDTMKAEKGRRPSPAQQAVRERLQEIYINDCDRDDPLRAEFQGELLAAQRGRDQVATS